MNHEWKTKSIASRLVAQLTPEHINPNSINGLTKMMPSLLAQLSTACCGPLFDLLNYSVQCMELDENKWLPLVIIHIHHNTIVFEDSSSLGKLLTLSGKVDARPTHQIHFVCIKLLYYYLFPIGDRQHSGFFFIRHKIWSRTRGRSLRKPDCRN